MWGLFSMDITDKILAELKLKNQSEKLTLKDIISNFSNDVLWLDPSDTNDIESQLLKSQYAYVKFGLILETIRNKCWWKRWDDKFSDFRQFCQQKVNLNIWQVSNAIKSAKVAIDLAFMGFEELPRNASQALKLADLSIDRLGEVWGNILQKCQGHKITADAIAQEINPDAAPAKLAIKVYSELMDKIAQQAIDNEMTIEEYLELLVEERIAADNVKPAAKNATPFDVRDHLDPADFPELSIEPVKVVKATIEPTPVSIEPVKVVKSVGNTIDRMRQAMYDRYLPKWKREVVYE